MKKTILFTLFALFAFTWQGKAQLAYDDTCTTPFEDISSTGTALNLSDDGEANITLPFQFTLDGVSSSDLRVGNNGGVLFGVTSGDVSAGNSDLNSGGNIGFYPFWDDIDDDSGNVYWEVKGTAPNRYVIIEWYQRPHYSNVGDATFELILYETTNEIKFLYQDLDFGNASYDYGASATIGIKGQNGVYQYSYNTAISSSVTCISWTVPSVYNPIFTTTVNPDCTNSEFTVDVEVTDLGGASSVTVSDDQGSTSQQLTAPGTVTFGPYADGTSVTFTVTNDDDNNYSSTETVEYHCPPAYDTCDGAVALTVSADTSNVVVLDNHYTTDSGVGSPGCGGYNGGDMWLSAVVPASGKVAFLTIYNNGISDTGMAVYTGDCNNLALVECDDDDGASVQSKIEYTGTPGETVYVRVWEYNNNSFGTIQVAAIEPPANDNCDTATEIASLPFNADEFAAGNFREPAVSSDCNSSMTNGLWYKFTVGQAQDSITVTVNPDSHSNTKIQVFSGDCGNLTCVADNDSGGYGGTDEVSFTPTSGTTYYVNIYESYSGSPIFNYNIQISGNSTLSATTISANDFRFYPNPTQGVITWDAQGTVDRIQVVDLTGKVLIDLTQPQNNSLDISRLNNGVYLLNVQMGDKKGTYRIIKE